MPDYTHEAQTESGQFLPPNQNNVADARARAAADKAYAKASRPWFKKKRFIIPGVLAALVLFGQVMGGGNDGDNNAAAPVVVAASPSTEAPVPTPRVTTPAPSIAPGFSGAAWSGKTLDGETITIYDDGGDTGFEGKVPGPIYRIDKTENCYELSTEYGLWYGQEGASKSGTDRMSAYAQYALDVAEERGCSVEEWE